MRTKQKQGTLVKIFECLKALGSYMLHFISDIHLSGRLDWESTTLISEWAQPVSACVILFSTCYAVWFESFWLTYSSLKLQSKHGNVTEHFHTSRCVHLWLVWKDNLICFSKFFVSSYIPFTSTTHWFSSVFQLQYRKQYLKRATSPLRLNPPFVPLFPTPSVLLGPWPLSLIYLPFCRFNLNFTNL